MRVAVDRSPAQSEFFPIGKCADNPEASPGVYSVGTGFSALLDGACDGLVKDQFNRAPSGGKFPPG